MANKFFIIICVTIFVIGIEAVPKKYENSQRNFYSNSSDQIAVSSNNDRSERLGDLSGLKNGIKGYPNSGGIGVYTPTVKMDFGSIAIGALVAIGALIAIPKFLSALSGMDGTNNYYRNADGDVGGIANLMVNLDDFLGKNNIDSATCMQHAVCSFVRSSEYRVAMGNADQIERLIHTLTQNSMINYIVDGTSIKEAIDNGKNPEGRDCDVLYPTCLMKRQKSINRN